LAGLLWTREPPVLVGWSCSIGCGLGPPARAARPATARLCAGGGRQDVTPMSAFCPYWCSARLRRAPT